LDERPEAGIEVQGTRFPVPKELGLNDDPGGASRGTLGAPSHDDVDEIAREGTINQDRTTQSMRAQLGEARMGASWRT
jgi:hypothetical protein